jgi:hypothetical protein
LPPSEPWLDAYEHCSARAKNGVSAQSDAQRSAKLGHFQTTPSLSPFL